jgi:hypothetical protein
VEAAPLARDKAGIAISRGTYLTDGLRLVEVCLLKKGRLICEEGSVEYPTIVSLGKPEVASSWRVVELMADAEAA